MKCEHDWDSYLYCKKCRVSKDRVDTLDDVLKLIDEDDHTIRCTICDRLKQKLKEMKDDGSIWQV